MGQTSLIWAQTNDGTIALNRQIPWHEKDDLKLFKELTQGKVVVMGRHTMESFNGHPLPNRINIVLTHDVELQVPEGFEKVYTVSDVFAVAQREARDLAVIGGKPIYEAFIDFADELYVTYLDTDFTGDVKMPNVDKTIWQGKEIAQGVQNENNDFDFVAIQYVRR